MYLACQNSPPINRNNPRKRLRPLLENKITLSDIFSPSATHKYVVIERTSTDDSEVSFEKVSSFKLSNAIQKLLDSKDFRDVKKLRNGTLLIKAANDNQVDKLLKMTSIETLPVKTYLHKQLNSSKGVVSCYDLMINTIDEIKEELASQDVIDVYRINSRRSGTLQPTPTLILTFSTPSVPSVVYAGFHKLDVRQYIPNPLRCYRCQRFGHSKLNCKGNELCVSCSLEAHGEESCKNDLSCVNCKGQHAASSRECPVYKQEKKVQELIVKDGITLVEARKRVDKLHSTFKPNLSFATAVSNPSAQSEHKEEIMLLKQQNTELLSLNKALQEKLDRQDMRLEALQNTINQLCVSLNHKSLVIEQETPVTQEEMETDVAVTSGDTTKSTDSIPAPNKPKLNRVQKKQLKQVETLTSKDPSTLGVSYFLKEKPKASDENTTEARSKTTIGERKKT